MEVCSADELEKGQQFALAIQSSPQSRGTAMPALPYLGMQALGRSIWPAGLALFLSVSTSILVFPFFPYIPSSGYFGVALPQVSENTCACRL